MAQTRGLDTTEDEATELVAHHLLMAALYFEATPKDFRKTHGEIKRILLGKGETEARNAASAFLENINASYEAMKERD